MTEIKQNATYRLEYSDQNNEWRIVEITRPSIPSQIFRKWESETIEKVYGYYSDAKRAKREFARLSGAWRTIQRSPWDKASDDTIGAMLVGSQFPRRSTAEDIAEEIQKYLYPGGLAKRRWIGTPPPIQDMFGAFGSPQRVGVDGMAQQRQTITTQDEDNHELEDIDAGSEQTKTEEE